MDDTARDAGGDADLAAIAPALAAALAAAGIATTTRRHAAVFTVAESVDLRGTIPGVHTKNLFLKDKKGRLFLVVAREDAAIDLKTLHQRIGAGGRVSFVDAAALLLHLGVEPGSVTAFAAMNDTRGRVTVVLDAGLLSHDIVNAHPMTNTATTSIASRDLLTFLRACGHEPLLTRLDAAPEDGSVP